MIGSRKSGNIKGKEGGKEKRSRRLNAGAMETERLKATEVETAAKVTKRQRVVRERELYLGQKKTKPGKLNIQRKNWV